MTESIIAQQTFDKACFAHDDGHLQEAQRLYLLLAGSYPKFPLLHYNLGLLYFQIDKFNKSLDHFYMAADLDPEDIDTLFNLALCQKKNKDVPGAISTLERILLIDPDDVESLFCLGGCYRDQYDNNKAINCYHRILALKPAYMPAVSNLAYVYHQAGENDKAIVYYSQVLEYQPENESVSYILSALHGIQLKQAPENYVRDFFNCYAGDFEHSLVVELGYDNPRQLFDCLGRSETPAAFYCHGLDLGCGTGLSGQVFKKIVTVLDGIDLSDKMLVQAASKGCYAHIHQDSIQHYLTSTNETYDFFIAADVFIYIGDLLPIFTLAQKICMPNALFCFSTERFDAEGYRLLPTGRFAYSPDYIRQLAALTGWTVVTQEAAPLRLEDGEWLIGDLWILRSLTEDMVSTQEYVCTRTAQIN